MRTQTWKYILAGALSGACGGLLIMLIATLTLYIGVLWQYAYNVSIPVIRDTALDAVFQDINRLPSFFWGWRWIIIGLTLCGCVLALTDHLEQRLPSPWRNRITPALLLFVAGAIVTYGLLAREEQTIQNHGDILPTLTQNNGSIWNVLLLAGPITLLIGGGLWIYWSWWNRHWHRWMKLANTSFDTVSSSSDEWFARRQARQRARLLGLIVLVASILLLIGVGAGYEQNRTAIQTGEIWIEAARPEGALRLELSRPTRHLLVENTHGSGSVEMMLLSAATQQPVSAPAQVDFTGALLSTDRAEIATDDLPAGPYLLYGKLLSGQGGRVGYALLQSNPPIAGAVSLLVALAAGAVAACTSLMLGLLRQRFANEET